MRGQRLQNTKYSALNTAYSAPHTKYSALNTKHSAQQNESTLDAKHSSYTGHQNMHKTAHHSMDIGLDTSLSIMGMEKKEDLPMFDKDKKRHTHQSICICISFSICICEREIIALR